MTVRCYETYIQPTFLNEYKKDRNTMHVEHVDTPWEFIYHAIIADMDSWESQGKPILENAIRCTPFKSILLILLI